MKKYFYLLSIIVLGLSACKKGDVTADQASIDDRKIQAYIAANYKTTNFTKDPSGVYYYVVKPGTGVYPNASSSVQVAFTGKMLNGDVFQTISNTTSPLSSFIKGWQIGLLHINVGGRLMLIVPSGLGYGTTDNDNSNIPGNSVLFFTIDLIGVGN